MVDVCVCASVYVRLTPTLLAPSALAHVQTISVVCMCMCTYGYVIIANVPMPCDVIAVHCVQAHYPQQQSAEWPVSS